MNRREDDFMTDYTAYWLGKEQEFQKVIHDKNFPKCELLKPDDEDRLRKEYFVSPAQFTKRISEVRPEWNVFLAKLGIDSEGKPVRGSTVVRAQQFTGKKSNSVDPKIEIFKKLGLTDAQIAKM